ncbi:MAG: tail fiber domain-containing protein [Bacteroidales bacterium]|nr:tail fiber domain-containing protein [Bacteroidales bacterium]
MRRTIIIISILISTFCLHGQNVGIGSTAFAPDPSAGLEVQYSDKGILIPRVALRSVSDDFTIFSPATSLLVYHTGSIFMPSGFYYNAGTPAFPSWSMLISDNNSEESVWSLKGNNGTHSGGDFIGTTDDEDFMIKVNNTESVRFTTHGQIEILNTGGSVFIGTGAGENDSHTNNRNVFVGNNSGKNNTYGVDNVAVGASCLYNNITGYCNTVIGSYAGSNITTGYHNLALGYQSLYYNTSGYVNSALSPLTLFYNTTGNGNTAAGYKALYNNLDGDFNAAYGYLSLYENTTGFDNTAMGRYALRVNTTGYNNTSVGLFSLYANTTGLYNAALGCFAFQSGNYNYSTALGCLAQPTADNQVRIGNSASSSIGGYANWSNISDSRFKENVQEDIPGLDFIMLLEPVTYNLNIVKIDDFLQIPDSVRIKDDSGKSEMRFSGFIAQDVEKAAQSIGYDFSGIDAPQNDKSHYGLRYAEFVVPLVKATQEQQVIIEEQKVEIDKQKQINSQQQQIIDDLLKRVEALENSGSEK